MCACVHGSTWQLCTTQSYRPATHAHIHTTRTGHQPHHTCAQRTATLRPGHPGRAGEPRLCACRAAAAPQGGDPHQRPHRLRQARGGDRGHRWVGGWATAWVGDWVYVQLCWGQWGTRPQVGGWVGERGRSMRCCCRARPCPTQLPQAANGPCLLALRCVAPTATGRARCVQGETPRAGRSGGTPPRARLNARPRSAWPPLTTSHPPPPIPVPRPAPPPRVHGRQRRPGLYVYGYDASLNVRNSFPVFSTHIGEARRRVARRACALQAAQRPGLHSWCGCGLHSANPAGVPPVGPAGRPARLCVPAPSLCLPSPALP